MKARQLSSINYNNMFFWINQRKGTEIYDFGFKQNFLREKGNVENIDIFISNSKLILKKDYVIGNFTIDNNEYNISNPINNSNLIETYDMDLINLNNNPEKLENKIATFEINNDILRETYFRYFI
tara:strand:+ start:174 stop:548 length:375 start_codon:yes stop_codon:yes gene_type:complete